MDLFSVGLANHSVFSILSEYSDTVPNMEKISVCNGMTGGWLFSPESQYMWHLQILDGLPVFAFNFLFF